MDRRKKTIFSIILKILTFLFVTLGIILCITSADSFMGGAKILFKYFTIQSNIFIGICSVVLAFKLIKSLKAGRYELSHIDEVFHIMFTVSITLTGIVYCFVLLPVALSSDPSSGEMMLAPQQLMLHVIVPVLSVADLLFFTRPTTYKFLTKDIFLSVIPPLYYLGFSRVGYVLNWDFGEGNNYPYFFLNYASPAGFFGFTGNPPYFMGVFWWILAILAFILIISKIYTLIINTASKRYVNKLI